jgi:hypothetical protein
MAKKKATKQTIIIQPPKAEAFDLSFTKTNENAKIIVALESLKHNAGWQFLVQVFEENLKYIGTQIISKTDGEKILTDSEVDSLRDKYAYLKEIVDKPDFFLNKLRVEDPTENTNLDPYDS